MGKTVLITGGATGLGRCLVKKFAKENYNIIFTYCHSEEMAKSLEKELFDMGVYYLSIACDLQKEDEINRVVELAYSTFSSIDCLVNNAAIEIDDDFYIKKKSTFMSTLEVNLVGPFLLSRLIGERMQKEKHGKIINIASNNAIDKNDPVTLEYDASKAGLISLTHNLAKAFAPFVNVNAIAPGWIKTTRIKVLDESLNGEFMKTESKKILLGRFAEEDEIADLVLFLASDKANYINDEVIRIDGGSC